MFFLLTAAKSVSKNIIRPPCYQIFYLGSFPVALSITLEKKFLVNIHCGFVIILKPVKLLRSK